MTEPDQAWVIPGSFMAEFLAEGGVKFTFTPAAGSAGYFGDEAWNFETGNPPENSEEFWDVIREALAEGGPVPVHWTE